MNNLTLVYSEEIFIPEINEYIYQPLFKDVVKMGEENFNKLMLPYILSLDMIEGVSEEEKKIIKVFDLIFCKNPKNTDVYLFEVITKEGIHESYLNILKKSLEFYFKKPIIINEENQIIMIGENGILYRDNFDILADIILKINYREKYKLETPTFKNDRQKDVYEKLMAGRQRQAKENHLELSDIANIVGHGGKTFISYKDINEMTISQLYNSYNTILTMDTYDREYSQYLVGAETDKLHIDKHWTQQIKIKTD